MTTQDMFAFTDLAFQDAASADGTAPPRDASQNDIDALLR